MTDEIVKSDFMSPAVGVADALAAYQAKADFIKGVLREKVDFDIIPGATKPSLLKPGAEKLVSFFGLATVFEDVAVVEDWTGKDHNGEPFLFYRQKCKLFRGERLIASADGSCNSWEKKYRYRNQNRHCPACDRETIIKGKTEYGGGWVCFAKKGGCGAKFADNDTRITSQEVGVIPNTDVAEQANTILKMAQKRALVAATLIATGVSDYFTQDVEDYQFVDASFVEAKIEAQPGQKSVDTVSTPQELDDVDKFFPPAVQYDKTKMVTVTDAKTVNLVVRLGLSENTIAAAKVLSQFRPTKAPLGKIVDKMQSYRDLKDNGYKTDAAIAQVNGAPVKTAEAPDAYNYMDAHIVNAVAVEIQKSAGDTARLLAGWKPDHEVTIAEAIAWAKGQ
uniref:Uncharacterized protein n=1 Tax=viral metagenome TaxID=1070528 RepID=A0A6H1ZAJ8_9ZZZZ